MQKLRRQKTEAVENVAGEQAQLQEHKNTGDSGDTGWKRTNSE